MQKKHRIVLRTVTDALVQIFLLMVITCFMHPEYDYKHVNMNLVMNAMMLTGLD